MFFVSEGLNEINIIAHSFGGRIAMILSYCFNINVKKMVLTGSAGLKPRRSLKYYYKVLMYKIKKHIFKNFHSKGSNDYNNASGVVRIVFVKVVNQHLDYLLYNIKSKIFLVWECKNEKI